MKGRVCTLLLAGALLLALCGCGGEKPAPTGAGGSAAPAPTGTSAPAPSASAAPSSEPEPSRRPEPPALELTVNGEKVPAGWHEGDGYRVLLPMTGVELTEWDEGETFVPADGADSYLSISAPGLPDVETAANWLRFEYAVEGEPEGCTFGAGDYAGLRLVQESDALTQEFILYAFGERVYLVERAVFAGAGTYAEALLEAALGSLEFLD